MKALFAKLGVNLLYSIAYYPQIDQVSKHINQTVEIALYFFIYILEDPTLWPKILNYNNTKYIEILEYIHIFIKQNIKAFY